MLKFILLVGVLGMLAVFAALMVFAGWKITLIFTALWTLAMYELYFRKTI